MLLRERAYRRFGIELKSWPPRYITRYYYNLRDNIHHSLHPKLLYYMNVTTYQDVTYIIVSVAVPFPCLQSISIMVYNIVCQCKMVTYRR